MLNYFLWWHIFFFTIPYMDVIGVLIIQNNVTAHYYTIGNLPYVSRRHVYYIMMTGVGACVHIILYLYTCFYLLQHTGAMGSNRGLCTYYIYYIDTINKHWKSTSSVYVMVAYLPWLQYACS